MIVFELFSGNATHDVSGLAFSPDGRWLAASTRGGPFVMMESRTGDPILSAVYGWASQGFSFSEDSKLFACALASEIVIHRIIDDPDAVGEADPPPRLKPIERPALEPAGPLGWAMRKLFGSVRPAESPVLTEWFVEDRERRKAPFKPHTKLCGRLAGHMLTIGFAGPTILRYWDWLHSHQWDASAPTTQGWIVSGSPFGSAGIAYSLRNSNYFALSPCGGMIVGYSQRMRSVAIWKWGRETPLHTLAALASDQQSKYTKVAISRDAEFVAQMVKARIRLVDGRTGGERFTVCLPNGVFTDIHLCANRDDFLASRKSGVVEVRSKRDGSLLQSHDWGLGKITAVSASADGCRFAAAGGGKIVVWDAE